MTQEELQAFEATLSAEKLKVYYSVIEPKLSLALIALRKLKPTVHMFKASFAGDAIGEEFTDVNGVVVEATIGTSPDEEQPVTESLGWWMWQLSMSEPAHLMLQAWQPEIEVLRLLHDISTLVEGAASLGIDSIEYGFENDMPTAALVQ